MPPIPQFSIFDDHLTEPGYFTKLKQTYGVEFRAGSVYCNLLEPFNIEGVQQVHNLGLMPQVVWEFGWSDQPIPHIAISNGDYDTQLAVVENQVKHLGYDIRISLFPEANLREQPWTAFPDKKDQSARRTNTPDTLKQAYRHVVDHFRKAGVTNVQWVWTVNRRFAGDTGPLDKCYPGSQWVDIKGLDGYNRGHLIGDAWEKPAAVYEPSLEELNAIDPDHPKPIMVMETGCVDEVPQDHATKAQWISQFVQLLPTLSLEYNVQEITFFRTIKEEETDNGKVTVDWTFDSKKPNLDAWRAGMKTLSGQ